MIVIDSEKSKIFINEIEVIDPVIIGKTLLQGLNPKPFKKKEIIHRFKAYCEKYKKDHQWNYTKNKIVATKERLVILDTIINSKPMFSVKDIYISIPNGFSISRTTVFKTFKLLEKAAIIKPSTVLYKNKPSYKYYSINS